jgi:hypothetical protein
MLRLKNPLHWYTYFGCPKGPAVADNQPAGVSPGSKTAMSNTFLEFTTRLREMIARKPLSLHPNEFNDLALALFRLQFVQNLPYQRYCKSQAITPDNITTWTQIPAIPIHAFKEFDLTCLPPDSRTTVFHSSGTTAQNPSRHFHSRESLSLYEASLLAWFASSVQAAPTRMFFLTPPPEQAPHSSLIHMFGALKKACSVTDSNFLGHMDPNETWKIDFHKLSSMQQSDTPVILFGTAFNFIHLLDFLGQNRSPLPPGSMIFETGGYKGRSREIPKSELHAQLKTRFGINKIISEYGMCELSSQAYETGSGLFQFPPWAHAQIVSPETGREASDGETGLLRLYDLANVYSVMAIQTEDMAVRRGEGFELLGRAAQAEARGCSLMSA